MSMDNLKIYRDFLRKCKDKEKLKPRTIKNTIQVLNPFIEFLGDRQITEEIVYDYTATFDEITFKRRGKVKKYEESTIYFIESTLKKFLTFYSPDLKDILKPKMPERNEPGQLITGKDIEKLIDSCRSTRDKALISFLYESGCRKGELRALQLSDLTFDENGAIVTIPAKKTKARTVRLVYSASYLRQWKETHPLVNQPDAALFCSLREPFETISNTGLHTQLKKITKRTGINKNIFPHLFRHTRATELADHLTEQQMKNYLGWTKSSSMAAVYVHMKDTDKAILRMHGIVTDDTEKGGLKVGRCHRCKELNPETSLYCGKCGLPLTTETINTLEKGKETVSSALAELEALDPELIQNLVKALKEKSNK